jgi:hypothetical protein
MNWFLKKLGYRDRQYRGSDFSVRIEPMGREAVYVVYTRRGTNLNLDGQRIGSRWEGIEVYLPPEVEAEQSSQIALDLETAFQAMDYGYVIARLSAIETVPETERQEAIAELRQMGYELEISADRKQIRQKWIAGTPKPGLEALRKTTPRYMSLIQAVHGTRKHFQILAKSKEFAP